MAVVGAGIAGCLLATLLARRGYAVDVYERRPDPRSGTVEVGRSINLALSARGFAALDEIGLREAVMARALPMRSRAVHAVDGRVALQSYSADGERAIHSVSRTELNGALLECADREPGVRLHFEHRLTDVDDAAGRLGFTTANGPVTVEADVVLATDGAYSAVRAALQFREGFSYSQEFLEHGYKELTIPAGPGGRHLLDPGALHIWPRGSSMMIALPNLDGSFTCTLFWPKDGEGGLASLERTEQVREHFAAHYPDAAALMPTLTEDYAANRVGSLVTVRCWPWVTSRVALVGDAAHAIVPFYGQGANCAMEDCVALVRVLEEHGGDWPVALEAYQRLRKPDADAIAAYALANFVEMRDAVGSRLFRWRTAARHALERLLGGWYSSRYELISFSTVPYSQIPGRLRRQDRAVGGGAALVLGLLAVPALLRRLIGPRPAPR